jgi:L-fuculose-phosphate aldolase
MTAPAPAATPMTVPPCAPAYASENQARAALCEAARSLDRLGINHGTSGNLSVRWHRGGCDGFLVTPSALPYERTGIDDIVWMSLDPAVGDESMPGHDGIRRPSSEWRLHRDLHARRADVGAVVHTHASHCTTLACLPAVQRGGIPAFHYMVAVAGGHDIRCAPYATFGTQQLSDHALAALAGRSACLLANHGMVAVGATLEAALATAVEVEALARMYWQALQLGEPVVLPDDEMARVLERFADYRQ